MTKKAEWELAGVIGVDAGLCWVGDPCYIIQDQGDKRPRDLGKDWKEFCDILNTKDPGSSGLSPIKPKGFMQFNYDAGHPGLGVCIPSGYGDGTYPVYIRKNKEGRTVELKVKFD